MRSVVTRAVNQIIGRTWVEQTETWREIELHNFKLLSPPPLPAGVDPGTIYIVRSPSHRKDVYKVGLTRRAADIRAKELTAETSTILPFEVLATWEVGDCATVESLIHERLSGWRINPRREFFHIALQELRRLVDMVVSKHNERVD